MGVESIPPPPSPEPEDGPAAGAPPGSPAAGGRRAAGLPPAPWLPDALRPLERALVDHHGGREGAVLEIRWDDGSHERVPAAHFFRGEDRLEGVEAEALARCRGRVLDVGAGAGVHTLPLEARGLGVTALEAMPGVAAVLRERGARDVREARVGDFQPRGRYDTVLVLMNGAGVAGTRSRLGPFLRRLRAWTAPGGRLLIDSTALEGGDPMGEDIQLQLAYDGETGPPLPHLYVGPEGLGDAASAAGWEVEIVARRPVEAGLHYLARLTLVVVAVVGALGAAGCGGAERWSPEELDAVHAAPGSPLPGLDSTRSAEFREGQRLFNRAFTPEEGLGPLFNEAQCSACHDLPASGGAGAELIDKATAVDPDTGRCDLLEHLGGDNIQKQATPLLREAGVDREPLPRGHENVVVSSLAAPAVFGLGLVEAVPDSAVLAWADPEDADGDGISGRAARTRDGALGRFGRKASRPTLRDFIVEAAATELGLTTSERSEEETVGGSPLPEGTDPAGDPELSEARLRALVAYSRLLALPARDTPADPARADSLTMGEEAFQEIGCAGCHRPVMITGRSDVPALDRVPFRIYSDFLLHDLGPGMATLCGPGVAPSEWRTAPLVGLRYRNFFLHDGRADTPDAAIRFHGGEARAAMEAYAALPEAERRALLYFIMSL